MTFKQIGMDDPFPHESIDFDYKIPNEPGELVYNKKWYQDQTHVLGLYVPSRKVMWKIMRACLNVQSEHELWFNNAF